MVTIFPSKAAADLLLIRLRADFQAQETACIWLTLGQSHSDPTGGDRILRQAMTFWNPPPALPRLTCYVIVAKSLSFSVSHVFKSS